DAKFNRMRLDSSSYSNSVTPPSSRVAIRLLRSSRLMFMGRANLGKLAGPRQIRALFSQKKPHARSRSASRSRIASAAPEMAEQADEPEDVGVCPEAGHATQHRRGKSRLPPELLARVRIGQMHLDDGHVRSADGIVQSVGGVRVGTG